jgi:hypothetical protein
VRVVEIPRVSPAVQIPVIVPRELSTPNWPPPCSLTARPYGWVLGGLTHQARNRPLDRAVRADA